ncbi:MAG: ABC transporter permease [Acetobacteraceae bacterium]
MSEAVVFVPAARRRSPMARFLVRNRRIAIGGGIILLMVVLAAAAPLYAGNPTAMNPIVRLEAPRAAHWFGTDSLGRDVFARTAYGAQISLAIGFSVMVLAVAIGMLIGLAAGYYRRVDGIVMRLMDALMSMPAILLAIALVALTRAGVGVVIIAILLPEFPREVRLVRAVVLSVREQPFVEAAIAGGARTRKVMLRHILPSTFAPLTVQGTYVCAKAILIAAALSYLGAGVPPEIPTWGNMIASSELYLGLAPWTVFFPGVALVILVLAVNLLGDGLRDLLDPRLARSL